MSLVAEFDTGPLSGQLRAVTAVRVGDDGK